MGHHCKDMAPLVYRVPTPNVWSVHEGQLDKSMLRGAASQVMFVVKNPSANAGDIKDASSIPGSGRSPGGGHGNPLQYSCLENPMAEDLAGYSPWVTKSWTWLSNWAHTWACEWVRHREQEKEAEGERNRRIHNDSRWLWEKSHRGLGKANNNQL